MDEHELKTINKLIIKKRMIHFLYNYFLTKKWSGPKHKFTHWFHWRLHKYLKRNLTKYYEQISKNALGVDSQSKIIVSLTTFPARIGYVHLAIKSLLHQTKRPNKVILWLGEEFFPEGENNLPESLLELKPLGAGY